MSNDNRVGFIQWIIGKHDDGFIGVGARVNDTNEWMEASFRYPKDVNKIGSWISRHEATCDLYFCPTILDQPKRDKSNITRSTVIWADLDDCHPDRLRIKPSIILETSPDRYQGFWKLTDQVHADDAELLNRKIAVAHKDDGADLSGWDLTQLLRIPGTRNFKYDDGPLVKIDSESSVDRLYQFKDLQAKYTIEIEDDDIDYSIVPELKDLPDKDPVEIIEGIVNPNPNLWKLYSERPIKDRSAALWQLLLLLLESGLTKEETFVVAKASACNKFDKDQYLWRDVVRASAKVNRKKASQEYTVDNDIIVQRGSILSEDDIKIALKHRTILDDYVEWASKATDAAPQYHAGVGVIVLSVLLSGSLRLYTQFGEIKPNIWVMISGDTTTSRKSTSMEMGTDIIDEVYPEALLATDGTIEGLVSSIATRPGRVSLFHRDEVSGLLEAMVRKDYNAGMLEAFTKLYDGKRMKRILRREQIDVMDPVFIMLTGGTTEGIYKALNPHHISSGFAPRFCFISAEPDPSRRRGLGPKTRLSHKERNALVLRFEEIFLTHHKQDVGNPFAGSETKEVTLSDEAWDLFNHFDHALISIADNSSIKEALTPMMARLSMSGLKISMLLAASRVIDIEQPIIVDTKDLRKAFWYVDQWKNYGVDVVLNAGRTELERQISDALKIIRDAGSTGITKAKLMQSLKLTARNAPLVLDTLEQRGLVFHSQKNRVHYYFPQTSSKANIEEFVV